MGEARSTERPKSPGHRVAVFLLRLVSALVVVAALAALTADLLDKAAAPATPVEDATPSEDHDEPERHRRRPQLVRATDPTVYDAQGDLRRCIRWRGSAGAWSGGDLGTISDRVERLRNLDFRHPVETHVVSRAEVGERFARGFLRHYGEREAERDRRVLTALGLVPEGTDLRALTSQFFTEGVAGFYNPRNGRLFSAGAGEALAPFDEVVLAHELDHALVDQALRLPGTLARDPMLGDVMLAHQALAEGDATLLMSKYAARRFPPSELASFMARFSQRPVPAPASIPYYVTRSSEFPYFEGLLFACGEAADAGWRAVDEIYDNPPASTADVLFPGRYRDGNEPALPRSPSAPGASWGPGRARSFGAFDLMVLLENADLASAGRTVPGSHVDAVRGWDGGVLRAWWRGEQTTIHVGLVDAGVGVGGHRRRRLCGVLRRWVVEAFAGAAPVSPKVRRAEAWTAGGDLVVLRCAGAAVELAKGPSPRAVRRVLRG